MATILYWNINNFTNERINLGKRKIRPGDPDYEDGAPGPEHLRMLLNTMSGTIDPATNLPVQLDFFVIVEIYSRSGIPMAGDLIDSTGRTGCINLLQELNGNINGNWSLVPPVVTGTDHQREAIAIYYRSDRWYFLGPATWPNAYPADLRGGLPNRTIPAANPPNPAYPYRAGQPENRGAGQWQFRVGAAPGTALVNFPYVANRTPWLTAFGDVANVNNLVRIMAMHTKPNDPGRTQYADRATARLADVYDMTARPPDAVNQIDVIVGDFNVDNLVAANFQALGPFGRLLGQGVNPVNPPYRALVQPPAGLNVNYNSYYHTIGRTPTKAIIAESEENFWLVTGEYPGQKYSSVSVDNALVRYRGGAAPPPPPPPTNPNDPNRMTILARARVQPYDTPFPAPGVIPMLGHYRSASYMEDTIDAIYGFMNDPYFEENPNGIFQETNNYRQVFHLSDHFALLFDV